MSNPCRRERHFSTGATYGTFTNSETGWAWKVVKLWQTPENAATNRFSRVMVAVSSPWTYGSYETGDAYLAQLLPEWNKCDEKTISPELNEWLERFNEALPIVRED